MVDLLEVQINWSSAGAKPGVSVLHFTRIEPGPVRSLLFNAMNDLDQLLHTTTTWSIATEGRIFDSETGTLTGAWSDPTSGASAGTSDGLPVPNASQLLVRLPTTTIVNGRFVRGRIFIPGLSNDWVEDGEVLENGRTVVAGAFSSAYLAASEQVVWSRPTDTRSGSAAAISGVTAWKELAVLRRRR